MLIFIKNKQLTHLSFLGKTIFSKGDINGMLSRGGFKLYIQGPGEHSMIPNISISLDSKNWSCGKFKGWTKVHASEVLEPDTDDSFKLYEDEEVSFEFCRGKAVRTYPLGVVKTENIFVIRNAVYKPYNEPFTVTAAPMYDKNNAYSHPQVFVKGIGAMVCLAKYSDCLSF